MSASDNKAVIRHHVDEIFNKGNLLKAEELVSPNYIHHKPKGEYE